MNISNTKAEEIYNKYSKQLYNTSLRIVKDSYQAEDIMQDTIIRYCNEKTFIENEAAWLRRVCITKSIDYLRQQKRKDLFISNYDTDFADTSQTLRTPANMQKLKEALYNLPDTYRITLSLLLLEGYDYEEIGEITKAPSSTVRSWVMRGKNLLIKQLN